MATTVVGGYTEALVDGVKIPVKSDVTIMHGTPLVDEVTGASGPQGVKVMPRSGRIKFSTTDQAGTDVKQLLTSRGVTVYILKPNGKGIVGGNCVSAGDGEYNSAEGELQLEFICETLEEVIGNP